MRGLGPRVVELLEALAWDTDTERHEAPSNRAEMKGLRRWLVAASHQEAGGSLTRETPVRVDSSPNNAGASQVPPDGSGPASKTERRT
jgi:hypothetical protein